MSHIQWLILMINLTSARKFHFRHNLQSDWNSLFLQLSNMDISSALDLLWNTENNCWCLADLPNSIVDDPQTMMYKTGRSTEMNHPKTTLDVSCHKLTFWPSTLNLTRNINLDSVWEGRLHNIPILVAIRWTTISNFNTTAFICLWWRYHC